MIHATAVVHPEAKIGSHVSIGPYTIIGAKVTIGDNTRIASHVVLDGHTRIGKNNEIFSFCSIGTVPQDKKYAGEDSCLEIGDFNTIREYCSLSLGTQQDGGVTRLGSHNWIMAYVHIAHDCTVGDNTVFSNNATLAGHVSVGDWATLGGFTGVHQFVRVGAHSFCGVGSVLLQDLPPYVIVAGNPAKPYGINSEGLKRRGFCAEERAAVKRAYRLLYRSGLSLEKARHAIETLAKTEQVVGNLAAFLAAVGKRGLVR